MTEYTVPKLVMGHIEVVAPDGEPGIPYDEAVIHLEGDDDSEIEVRCPGALRLAPVIVAAVNNHAPMLKTLGHCAQLFDTMAQTLDRWAIESREGGWSTHQVQDNRKRADDCRRYAASIRSALPNGERQSD